MTKERMSLAIDSELRTWLDFMAGINGTSATAYINRLIHRDMEGAKPEVSEAFEAFTRAQLALGIDAEQEG